MIETYKKIENIVEKLSSTKQKTISIKVNQVDSLDITDNKFGGCPYIPKSVGEIPMGTNENILTLLAQFNLDTLPKGIFPLEKGILQFFIDCDDDCYGMDFDDALSGEGHKVVYYENIEEAMTEDEINAIYEELIEEGEFEGEEDYKPFDSKYNMGLTFEIVDQIISLGDYRFSDIFIETWNKEYPEQQIENYFELISDEKLEDEEFEGEKFYDMFIAEGHRLLGYPEFAQDDPREYNEDLQEYELLFQMDSDFEGGNEDRFEICWGDAGVCNFFIKKEDLENKDFSNVFYNWDCS